jgi:DNA-binding response OmpR family regulator
LLDARDRSVDLGGTRIQLSPLEFGVLHTLAAHPATPVSRADLLREVWGTSYDGGSNTVDVVIRSLRRKLGAVADRIETVRGVGYRLR